MRMIVQVLYQLELIEHPLYVLFALYFWGFEHVFGAIKLFDLDQVDLAEATFADEF